MGRFLCRVKKVATTNTNKHSQRRVIVIVPLVPEYRRALYAQLHDRLKRHDIDFVVMSGEPSPRIRDRSDRILEDWSRPLTSKWIQVWGKEIGFRTLGYRGLTPYDYVIVEQALKNMETYPLLALMKLGRIHLAMWGHGDTYSVTQSKSLRKLKILIAKSCERVFVYTEMGSQYLIKSGVEEGGITILNNSIDTETLSNDLDLVTDIEKAHLKSKYDLTEGRTALFIGGVDKSKGIPFLVNAAKSIAQIDPTFRLLIVGEGSMSKKLKTTLDPNGPIFLLGRRTGREKAIALSCANVLTVPEWIGLVSVDSLVSGVPIVSTDHPSHSPEKEYLVDGETAVFSNHNVIDYAQAVYDVLSDPVRLQSMRAKCLSEARNHSFNDYVDRFEVGILDWIRASDPSFIS